jgi:hypothetical protein
VKNIRRTSDIVKDILENCPDARNSDDLLYINVCKKLSPMVCTQPFQTVLLMRNELGIPPFESVRRTRQKLQAAYPELCGSDEVEAQRVANEEIVKNYARSFRV